MIDKRKFIKIENKEEVLIINIDDISLIRKYVNDKNVYMLEINLKTIEKPLYIACSSKKCVEFIYKKITEGLKLYMYDFIDAEGFNE